MPIAVPAGVEIALHGRNIVVKGPKGTLERDLVSEVTVDVQDSVIAVNRPNDAPRSKAMHGLTRTLIANMVDGVTKGFEKKLELVGVGYRAAKSGTKLILTVGYSHPVEIEAPSGIDFEVVNPTNITVRGINKETVGATAAKIRGVRPPEPYQGKGIKYQGERILRKVGKTGKK